MHQVAALRELEETLSREPQNIAPFSRASSKRLQVPSEQSLKHAGEEALALANALARMIAENEARACDLVQRAVNDLAVAHSEIEALQARATRAEQRAERAESYLLRIEDALEKLFERGSGGVGAQRSLRAA